MNKLLQSNLAKRLQQAIEDDQETSARLNNQLERLQNFSVNENLGLLRDETSIGMSIRSLVRNGLRLGNIGSEAGGIALQGLGIEIAGIVLGAVTLVMDIRTLVTTFMEVHKGSILKVVEHIRQLAERLEDNMNLVTEIANIN